MCAKQAEKESKIGAYDVTYEDKGGVGYITLDELDLAKLYEEKGVVIKEVFAINVPPYRPIDITKEMNERFRK